MFCALGDMPTPDQDERLGSGYISVEVWSVAVYCNAKFCGRSWPRSEFSGLQAFVVQILFLGLKLLVK